MRQSMGFGLLELMVTLVVAALLITLAVPAYDGFVQRARVARAIGDISTIALEVEKFRLKNDVLPPPNLGDLPIQIPLDPWDRPYQYVNILGGSGGGYRKDGNLNPINTDFDLYSLGKDGDSSRTLNASNSRDDIVRANNGAFVGQAEDY